MGGAYDLVLTGRAFVGGSVREVTIAVADGVIARVLHGTGNGLTASSRLDFASRKGTIILPGFIDLHVHLRGLGLSYKEDEASGTASAAGGGVTVVVDMPNTVPRLTSSEAVRAKLEALENSALVDYGVYAGVPDAAEVLIELVKREAVVGVKVYPEDLLARAHVIGGLRALRGGGTLVVLHAEHPYLIRDVAAKPGLRHLARPSYAEVLAIEELKGLVGSAVRLHLTHASTPSAVLRAKELGYTVDTAAHYLLLSSHHEAVQGCLAKVNPPLRDRATARAMLELLLEGVWIDVLASDHAPHTAEEKGKAFQLCPPGVPGLEHAFLMLAAMVSKGLITVGELVRLASEGPAKVLGISSAYGFISEGYRANFTVINFSECERPCSPRFSKAKLSPTYGLACVARLEATIVGGVPVYLDGEVTGSKPMALNVAEVARLGRAQHKHMRA